MSLNRIAKNNYNNTAVVSGTNQRDRLRSRDQRMMTGH